MTLLPLTVVLSLLAVDVLAARTTVPPTRIGRVQAPVTANALRPPQCRIVNLGRIVVGSGRVTDGSDSSLILGSPANDTIRGGRGDDCILAGGGNDDVRGDRGSDVCVGGPGNDRLRSCEQQYP